MSRRVEKVSELTRLLFKNSSEFFARMMIKTEVQLDSLRISGESRYDLLTWEQSVQLLEQLFTTDLEKILREESFKETESWIAQRRTHEGRGFNHLHDGAPNLGKLCYVVCRIMKPQVVVETGVAHGLTTAFILSALRENQAGTLHSIDLPPLVKNADNLVGKYIPDELKARWNLCRGSARVELPKLLRALEVVDVFIHDSLHTYRHMLWEFETVRPRLAPRGVVISDDIAGNDAFADWVSTTAPTMAMTLNCREKRNGIGIAVMDDC